MEEKTTTDVTTQDTGVSEETQPVEGVQTEAVQETTEQEQQVEQPSEPSEDDQLASWAEKKGLTLDSDNAKKAAKMAREAEKAMHQKAQRASELEKTLSTSSDEVAEQVAQQTGQDPELIKRLQRVEVKDAVRDFWDSKPDARQYEAKMIEILGKKPHLAGDLDSLYANAVIESGQLDTVKSQGRKEALQTLAHNQQAAVPTGSATNPGIKPPAKDFKDLSIKEMEAKLGFVRR